MNKLKQGSSDDYQMSLAGRRVPGLMSKGRAQGGGRKSDVHGGGGLRPVQ